MLTIKKEKGKIVYEYEVMKREEDKYNLLSRMYPNLNDVRNKSRKKEWILKHKKPILEIIEQFVSFMKQLNYPNHEVIYYPGYFQSSIVDFLYATRRI